jgi:glycogen operon protein
MHVGGFTRHPSSGVTPSKRGTYAGLIEKIPYLQDLGVSAIELLPIFAFDEQDGPPGLSNYWGYQPLSFSPPMAATAPERTHLARSTDARHGQALHRAGIEVILDVVYNHTDRGKRRRTRDCFQGQTKPIKSRRRRAKPRVAATRSTAIIRSCAR